MALKLDYYGQNDGTTVPDVSLTGDPGTDQAVLTAAGFLGGRIMCIVTLAQNQPQVAGSPVIAPCDADLTDSTYNSGIPYATLLNGPGEFAGAIGPAGSRKAPVVRALWRGNVNNEAYDANANFLQGGYVYCGGHTNSNVGKYTSSALKGSASPAVGICFHVPSASEPWLGVASLL
jgi:hypothetical protein